MLWCLAGDYRRPFACNVDLARGRDSSTQDYLTLLHLPVISSGTSLEGDPDDPQVVSTDPSGNVKKGSGIIGRASDCKAKVDSGQRSLTLGEKRSHNLGYKTIDRGGQSMTAEPVSEASRRMIGFAHYR